MANAAVKPVPLSEEEIRKLFEDSIFGIKDTTRAVPTDRFFATLEKAATDPSYESYLPALVAMYYSFYVKDYTMAVGNTGVKFDLAQKRAIFQGVNQAKMVVNGGTILPNFQKQKDVVTENHFQFI